MDTKVLQRTDDVKEVEKNIKNKWNWSWPEEKDGNGDFMSEYIRKINQPGMATCVWCNKMLKYASGGKKLLMKHALSDVHLKARTARSNTQELPVVFQAMASKISIVNSEASSTSSTTSAKGASLETNNAMDISHQHGNATHICHRCKKPLAENETINNERAGAPTPDGEIDYDYCWDCFALLHDIGFKKDVEQSVKCKLCKTRFANRDSLRAHKLSHHGGPPNKCQLCNVVFKSRCSYRRHKQMHKRGKNKFLCSFCPSQFNHKYSLTRHEMKHQDLLPHKCKFCDKKFAAQSILQRHERIHTGERPFLCSWCGKGFNQSGPLQAHERLHKGELPFACQFCDKRFVQSHPRKIHEKTCMYN